MHYQFEPMTSEAATSIDNWHYREPYSFYDLDADPEDRALFLDESRWSNRSFAIYEIDDLIGFFTFDVDTNVVEIGLGMAPERTGQGDGCAFVCAGLDFARERYDVSTARLSVATFNERAIRVYEMVGFARGERFMQETNGDEYEFIRMHRQL